MLFNVIYSLVWRFTRPGKTHFKLKGIKSSLKGKWLNDTKKPKHKNALALKCLLKVF